MWISDYIENPDFIEFPDYYLNSQENSNNNTISTFLDEEEYFSRRLKSRTPLTFINHELRKKIYNFIKYSFTNPLTLQELARISIRKHLLTLDYRIKDRVTALYYPNRLKKYILFNEFINT